MALGLGLGVGFGVDRGAALWLPPAGYSQLIIPGRSGEVDGAGVATSTDLSGNGHDFTQAAAPAQFVHVGSLAGLNGKAAYRGSATRYMASTYALTVPCTIRFVLLDDGSAANCRILDGRSAGHRMLVYRSGGNPTTYKLPDGNGAAGAALNWSPPHLFTLVVTSARIQLWIDAVSSSNLAVTGAPVLTGQTWGAQYDGGLSAKMYFGALETREYEESAGQRAMADASFAAEYGVAL